MDDIWTHVPHGHAWPWGPVAGFGLQLRERYVLEYGSCARIPRHGPPFMCGLWKGHQLPPSSVHQLLPAQPHVAHGATGVQERGGYAVEEMARWW